MENQAENLKILVRMPNWLGDAVMATGVLDQIQMQFPSAQVSITGPGFICDLFRYDPRVRDFFPYRPKKAAKYNPFHKDLIQMRAQHFDLAILLTQSFSTAWQIWWTRAKHRIGFANEARGFLLTHPFDFPENRQTQHLVLTYQELLKLYQGRPSPVFKPKLYVSEQALSEARDFFNKHLHGYKVIGLCPQAAYGPAKQWPWERFRGLAQLLNQKGYAVMIFADAQGKELGQKITQGLESSLCIDMSAKTNMMQFMAFMKQCDLLVTNDSGPMHLATALDKSLVALFGSTDDKVTGPYSDKAFVIHKRVECSPCFKRVCPIDFRCMNRIEVQEVFERIEIQLKHESEKSHSKY